ncbi:MAG: hypothetical protein Q8L74_11350 [Nitrospirota bacterium]|nr:hypothetical protein [Nitrospirota bacterium]MDP2383020.1 hypothetical protein [Nitrospirota bacterium]MDP3597458.1 hypothetical protein [Nitrospirota bacterium]
MCTRSNSSTQVLLSILAAVGFGLCAWDGVEARDSFVSKEQASTEADPTQSPSFDVQKKGIPQSLFTWIKMARGYEVEWDTFGRKGWYTQDPRLKPVEPGAIFTPETPVVYIVFEVAPLEDPALFGVQWFLDQPGEQLSEMPVGKDAIQLPGHERYGYLELKKSGERWAVGNYVAKIFITPLGQQPFHAANQVGTMRFVIVEQAAPAGINPHQ